MVGRAKFWGVVSIFVLTMSCGLELSAQEQAAGDSNSLQFQTPIPVTLRKSTNSLMQGMLVGISDKSISFMNPQGRTFEFPNNTVKFIRSLDGSFSYSPGKDNATEVIQRMRALQTAAPGPNGTAQNPGPGQSNPNGAHGTGTTPTGSVPFTPIQPPTNPAAGAHGQTSTTGSIPFTPIPSQPGSIPGTTHAQPMPASSYSPPSSTIPSGSHSPMPSSTMPMGSHASMPASPTPHSMPMSSHTQMPGMAASPMMPQMQSMYEYQCSKCRHRFTSTVEIKAGHRCTKCGIVWGQVKDESGKVVSSSPAARIGGGVGIVALIIGVIVAIVRKSQSA